MIGPLQLWRVMAWIGAKWRSLRARKEEGSDGWPDKSPAVGVGVGDWNYVIISAVALNLLLALKLFYLMISTHNARSAADTNANCSR